MTNTSVLTTSRSATPTTTTTNNNNNKNIATIIVAKPSFVDILGSKYRSSDG